MKNVVFGAGICTQNHWKYIKKYFNPDFLVDNDMSKWGNYKVEDMVCVSPENVLGLTDVRVLISVGDPYIICQIREQLDAKGIECITIYEFIEMNALFENPPKHLRNLEKSGDKGRILLFNGPEHNNIGDHLISIAEQQYKERNFSGYEYYEITDCEYLWFHTWIKSHVTKDDMIWISGGGYLGSLYLYNGELNVRNIILEYPENKITIFPQTIYFEDNVKGRNELEKTKTIYNKHSNLTVCVREKKSEKSINMIFNKKNRIGLMPDIVLSMNYSVQGQKRSGILLCLRKDKESILGEFGRKSIMRILQKFDEPCFEISMRDNDMIDISNRQHVCDAKVEEIRTSKLVVTDTLHCMILCVITGTPCIAFDNISQKVQHVYEWVSNLDYIYMVRNMDTVCDIDAISHIAEKLLMMPIREYDANWYVEYEKKLTDLIIGE